MPFNGDDFICFGYKEFDESYKKYQQKHSHVTQMDQKCKIKSV